MEGSSANTSSVNGGIHFQVMDGYLVNVVLHVTQLCVVTKYVIVMQMSNCRREKLV